MLERDRLLDRARSVAERGLEVDESLDAGRQRRLDDIRGSERVGAHVLGPVVRILVRGGGMDDAFRSEAVEGGGNGVGVRDRLLDEGQRLVVGQVVATTGRVVVDDQNLMTVSQ